MKKWLLCACLLSCCSFSSAVDIKDVREKAAASGDELDKNLTLFFKDALTGKGIPDAQVSLGQAKAKTDADGQVTLPFPAVSSDEETTLYAQFRKKGYVESKVPLLFRLGMIFNYHYSISPALPAGQIRVVLDWGREPADLDAHLVKEGAYHISFRDMHQAEDQARLDHDCTTGEGPETITILKLDPEGNFVFYVHDFTDRGDGATYGLAQSHARVSVFGDGKLVGAYNVPSGRGNHWTVFFVRNGQIVPASHLGDQPLGSASAASQRP
jgi:hypothetical protein